jgi:creatinine amidohydrolase
LSWTEVAQRVKTAHAAVLPVGAASKAHGPHLPMNADWLQAEWLADALVRRAEVLVWPTVGYGYYPAFTDYPGTVSLGRDRFQFLIEDILAAICAAGARSVLIVNTGISTIEPLRAALGAVKLQIPMDLANIYEGPVYRSEAAAVEEQPAGGHADELETSILLALGRHYVSLDKAQAWTPAAMAVRGPFSRSDADSPRYSPDGIWGDPTLASVAKGRRLLKAMVEDLAAAVEALRSP